MSPSSKTTRQQAMHHRPHNPQPRPLPRRGFSLVELMIVIVIIAILVALLLPAIGSVRRSAAVAQVSVEIKGLESAMTNFKTEFGIMPPSSISLYENTGLWASGDVTSRTLIRRLWPQFDFGTTASPNTWDINGDGDTDDSLGLNGSECLVFFLGGVMATNYVTANDTPAMPVPPVGTDVGNWAPLGFSKNPRNPFERSAGTRIGPFTELDVSRFVDIFDSTGILSSTPDGMPEYLDALPSQTQPYLYVSSNDGRGYDAADFGGAMGSMGRVYLQKWGGPAWNQTGVQIISAGFDTEYRNTANNYSGGLYEKDKELGNDPSVPADTESRAEERDNITNFSGGQLSS